MTQAEQLAEATKDVAPWEGRTVIVPSVWYTSPPPPQSWLLRDARANNEGVLPVGKVALLLAKGGAGKTMALTQLAVATATGTSWLGTFDTPIDGGKVLLILGEEDEKEAHRRIHRAAQVAGVTPEEGSIVVLPLAGIVCPMVEGDAPGKFLLWLIDYVTTTGPYALVIVDPISRFCGPDAETDNAAATRFIQLLESLIVPAGDAAILGSHHTNKISRGDDDPLDAHSGRGSSALGDGARWVATLGTKMIEGAGSVIRFTNPKNNLARKADPVELRYGEGGGLVLLDEAGQAASIAARVPRQQLREQAKAARSAEMVNAVVARVTATPGISKRDLRDQVRASVVCGSPAADVAIAAAILEGRIRTTTHGKREEHWLTDQPQGPTVVKAATPEKLTPVDLSNFDDIFKE